MLTEIFPIKPKLLEKFAGFTEATLCFTLPRTFALGAEHPCTPKIRRTVFANAGFKVMVRTADPEIPPIFISAILYNIGCFFS